MRKKNIKKNKYFVNILLFCWPQTLCIEQYFNIMNSLSTITALCLIVLLCSGFETTLAEDRIEHQYTVSINTTGISDPQALLQKVGEILNKTKIKAPLPFKEIPLKSVLKGILEIKGLAALTRAGIKWQAVIRNKNSKDMFGLEPLAAAGNSSRVVVEKEVVTKSRKSVKKILKRRRIKKESFNEQA